METLEQKGNIFIITLPVAFTVANVAKLDTFLDQVQSSPSPKSLIVTSKHPKIFNAGFDTKFIMEHGLLSAIKIGESVMKFGARIMTMDCPTVACINGHAVAAGYIVAACTDYLIMRSDFGHIQLSEILNGIITATGPNQVLKVRLHPSVHRDMVLRGIRYDSGMALREGIVDEVCTLEELMDRGVKQVEKMMSEEFKSENNIMKVRRERYRLPIELCSKGEFDKRFADEMLNPKI